MADTMTKHFYCLGVPGWASLQRNPDTLDKEAYDKDNNLIPNAKPNIKWSTAGCAQKDTPIMLAHCGKSNIIAIDWDGVEGEHLFNHHLLLDPTNPLITKGVGKGGGHFMYSSTLLENGPLMQALNNQVNRVSIAKTLDILQGSSLVYLPTEANHTKSIVNWKPQDIKPMPLAVEYLLASTILAKTKPKCTLVPIDAESNTSLYGHVLKQEIAIETLMEQLTPNRMRVEFQENSAPNRDAPGQMYHPDNLPMDSNAQDYLHAISTTLAMDSSVSEDQYRKTLTAINNAFSQPKAQAELDNIMNYAISNEQINSKKMWRYNPEWETQGMTYLDQYNHTHEVFYAKPITGSEDVYVDYNHSNLNLCQFKNKTKLTEYILASLPVGSARRNIAKLNKVISSQIRSSTLVSEPMQDFGPFQLSDKHIFNIFLRTPELETLHKATMPKNYKHPSLTLHMLRNVVGPNDPEKLERLLRFYKRKFTTYDHSPQIHIFWGVPGSGKSSVYQGIFAPFMPDDRLLIAPATSSGDQFNSQLKNKDIVCVDEIHTLQKSNRKLLDIIVAQANAISGQDTLRGLRAMQTVLDSTPIRHSITFGFTCNAPVQLIEETRDRRTVVYYSSSSFSDYMASEGLNFTDAQVKAQIASESMSFAYYLATEVSSASDDEYYSNKLEKDAVYKKFYANALPLVKKIGLAKEHPETLLDILKEAQLYDEQVFIKACKIPQRKTYVQVCMLNIGSQFNEPEYPGILDNVADAREYRAELGENNIVNSGEERRVTINLEFKYIPIPLLEKIANSWKQLEGTKIEKFILVNKKDK